MKSKKHPLIGWSLALALGFVPDMARACATCFGAPDSKMTEGLNMGILSLLLVVLFVLGMTAVFAVYLARKAASVAAEGTEETSTPTEKKTY